MNRDYFFTGILANPSYEVEEQIDDLDSDTWKDPPQEDRLENIYLDPYKRLLHAVLMQAINDVAPPGHIAGHHYDADDAVRGSALRWFQSDSVAWFSFIYICDHLSIPVEDIRRIALNLHGGRISAESWRARKTLFRGRPTRLGGKKRIDVAPFRLRA